MSKLDRLINTVILILIIIATWVCFMPNTTNILIIAFKAWTILGWAAFLKENPFTNIVQVFAKIRQEITIFWQKLRQFKPSELFLERICGIDVWSMDEAYDYMTRLATRCKDNNVQSTQLQSIIKRWSEICRHLNTTLIVSELAVFISYINILLDFLNKGDWVSTSIKFTILLAYFAAVTLVSTRICRYNSNDATLKGLNANGDLVTGIAVATIVSLVIDLLYGQMPRTPIRALTILSGLFGVISAILLVWFLYEFVRTICIMKSISNDIDDINDELCNVDCELDALLEQRHAEKANRKTSKRFRQLISCLEQNIKATNDKQLKKFKKQLKKLKKCYRQLKSSEH